MHELVQVHLLEVLAAFDQTCEDVWVAWIQTELCDLGRRDVMEGCGLRKELLSFLAGAKVLVGLVNDGSVPLLEVNDVLEFGLNVNFFPILGWILRCFACVNLFVCLIGFSSSPS